MKYIVIFILAIALLIGLNFLLPQAAETEQAKIPDLKIDAYVFADETVTDPNEGSNGKGFCFKALELGQVYLLAPVVGTDETNLCFDVEFSGGEIEMISVDQDIQLSVADGSAVNAAFSFNNRQFGYTMRISGQGKINANPIGSGAGYRYITDENMENFRGYTGRAYMISINAYEFDNENSAVITAQLRLTQLQDDDANTLIEGGSKFYSVELISYELGSRYQMIQNSLQ